MTRKSTARLERDAKEKKVKNHLNDNACWDELNSMYSSMCQLLSSHSALSNFIKDKQLADAIVDKALLISNLNILTNDLASMNKELSEIHELHANKVGGTNDPDVLMSSIAIFEMYNLFMERHDAVVMPTAYHLIEQFDQAEKILAEKELNKNNLTDPNVISDVEFKILEGDVIPNQENNNIDFDKLHESFTKIHAVDIDEVMNNSDDEENSTVFLNTLYKNPEKLRGMSNE